MVHSTKGIVLRTVKYGDTSIVTTVYTELFGVQTYLVKGVRQSSKTSSAKANFFQPSAILDMQVFHNDQKQLQFIKEFEWGYLYENILFDVIKNTVAQFVIELLQHCLKQPEANPELFYLIEDTLKQLDKGNATLTGNLPLYFSLHLNSELGFKMNGSYSVKTPVLDLKEGMFITQKPSHPYFIDGILAQTTSQLLAVQFYQDLENIQLPRSVRRELLLAYQTYLLLHVPDFKELKSLAILQELLS